MADPFVSGVPEAEKDPSDGRTRKGLPAYRAGPRIHSAGIIYFQGEINARCLGVSHVLHRLSLSLRPVISRRD